MCVRIDLKVSIFGDKRLVPKKSPDNNIQYIYRHHDRSHNPLLRMRARSKKVQTIICNIIIYRHHDRSHNPMLRARARAG